VEATTGLGDRGEPVASLQLLGAHHLAVEELEHDDAHLLIASAAELRHHAKPVFVLQFFCGHSLDHVQ